MVIAVAVIAACSADEPPGPGTYGAGADAASTPAVDANAGVFATPGTIEECNSCHTPSGQPAMSGAIDPLPGFPEGVKLYAPNLTPDMETGIGGWTDGALKLAIRDGVDKEGLVLCPQMKHYKTMTEDQLNNIIKYLRGLPATKHAVQGSICPPLKR